MEKKSFFKKLLEKLDNKIETESQKKSCCCGNNTKKCSKK